MTLNDSQIRALAAQIHAEYDKRINDIVEAALRRKTGIVAATYTNANVTFGPDGRALFAENGAAARKAVRVYNNTSSTVATGGSQKLTWAAATYDDAGFWSGGAADRLTFPVDGDYLLLMHMQWGFTGGGTNMNVGDRGCDFTHKNSSGTTLTTIQLALPSSKTSPSGLNGSPDYVYSHILRATAGQRLEVTVSQDSGGNLTTATGADNTFLIAQLLGTA